MTISTVSGGPAFALAYRGSVNRWECDENDHLNVRFYSRMAGESIANALAERRVPEGWRVRIQHIRYLAEARLATPVSGYVALIAAQDGEFLLLTELRHTFTGKVLAAFLTQVECVHHGLEPTSPLPLAAHVGPRGLSMEDTPYSRLSLDEAKAHGFKVIAKGIIARQECDVRGELPLHGIMARMSDGMPNLWAILQSAEEQSERANGFQGGAVLEYRKYHHRMLKADDRYEVVSGIREVTGKLQYFVHLLYDVVTGQCIMSAEAVAVVLDLVARRAIVIPSERRERLLSLKLKSVETQC